MPYFWGLLKDIGHAITYSFLSIISMILIFVVVCSIIPIIDWALFNG